MKIKNIKINSYGILKNKEINLENNLNIIYGKNESGKSTLLNYIKNIFYGISKNKNGKDISDFEKYNPWVGEEFSGKIKYELDDKKTYEVFRDFNKKNAKVFDENLDDISASFKIDKKDGNQFFFDQTGVDEKTYISTIMSPQKEVILDLPSQNVLVQRMANLGGTGDDKVSFKKALDNLNKRQVEEVGTSRTQDRPLNIVQKRMKEIETDLKTEKYHLDNKQNLMDVKDQILSKLEQEKMENNVISKLTKFYQKNQIDFEKNKIKINLKNNNEEKLQKLIQEKNNLLRNISNNNEKNDNKNLINEINKTDFEKNNLNKNNLKNSFNNLELNSKNNKTKKLNKKIKNNYIIFGIIFLILIILNIFNFKLISNKIINYIFLLLIPTEIILFIFNLIKNKKIKNKLEKEILIEELNNKMQKQKEEEQLTYLNNQIDLLNSEIEKQKNEIMQNEQNIDNERDILIRKIQDEYQNYDFSEIFNIETVEELQKKLENSDKQILNYQIELNKIEYEEKDISNKLEEIVSLNEEYENLKEELEVIEEKNKCIQATKELLERAYEKMKKNVTPKFTENLSRLIDEITDGKYKKVSINEDEGLIVELENGEYIPVRLLSTGTIEQLYLSLRLSMLDEISKEKMPIILDETFAYFDDERLENSLLYLINKAKEHQILLFTCTKREKEILDKLNMQYNWVEI